MSSRNRTAHAWRTGTPPDSDWLHLFNGMSWTFYKQCGHFCFVHPGYGSSNEDGPEEFGCGDQTRCCECVGGESSCSICRITLQQEKWA